LPKVMNIGLRSARIESPISFHYAVGQTKDQREEKEDSIDHSAAGRNGQDGPEAELWGLEGGTS
jgi:hypothetical protein